MSRFLSIVIVLFSSIVSSYIYANQEAILISEPNTIEYSGEWEISRTNFDQIPLDNWESWDLDNVIPAQERVWFRSEVSNHSDEPVPKIIYLGKAQDATVYIRSSNSITSPPFITGTTLPSSHLQVPNGMILSGMGNSAQVRVLFPPGISYIYISYKAPVFENVSADFKLFSETDWHRFLVQQKPKKFLTQGLILGALLIISLYHFLIFAIRRDWPFFWYSVYTIAVAIMLSLEIGLLQTILWKEHQLNYRILWEAQTMSMVCGVLYFIFMRSFLDLEKLLPRLDKLVTWFLIIYIPFGILADAMYWYNLEFTPFNYIFPLSVLSLGLYCVYRLVRTGNKLAMYFAAGSLALFAFTFSNTVISILVSMNWINEPEIPRIWLTETGIIVEILIFSLGLGYRLRLQDQEKEMAVTRLRTKISSDLHDDVGSMLTGLSMQSNVMSYTTEGPMKEKLEQISEISRNALETMRDTVWAIDARQDNYESLIDKMRDFAELNIPNETLSYKLKTSGLQGRDRIPPDIRQQTYLIFKEGITNAIKYCDGDQIHIQVHRKPQRLELIIHDNGSAQPKDYHSGQGIQNMKMRAEQLGGSLTVNYVNGCKIALTVEI